MAENNIIKKDIVSELSSLITEQVNPLSTGIDLMSVEEILKVINKEDKNVPRIVSKEIPHIAKAVDIVVDAFKNNGKLFYVGAGTSGRLGVLDASECPPTFGTDPEMVQGIVAGGYGVLVRAKEGCEDKKRQGGIDLIKRGFTKKDAACGIAASWRTPYVIGAIERARKAGGKTIYIACTPRDKIKVDADVIISPVVGPEVIMGSTRMKSGTAQKLILNMITTASMIRLGKVYKNMMVDLQMNSVKLKERSKRTIMMVTGVDYNMAEKYLLKSGGNVKTAIVMILGNSGKKEAVKRLKKANGFVRKAIENSL
ncbi:N-acetylmuramic acid 6-phosphate etherase [bacterium]|nr:N-acetylmuramic acid 6-phosphate etherase [bacterium]